MPKALDRIAVGAVIVVITMLIVTEAIQRHAELTDRRKNVVCPSFLSIARSARDTLIVMRNDPLCNRYVLDNLK
jgi:hypothetical protein